MFDKSECPEEIKKHIHDVIVGAPEKGILGLQDDWWTGIAPDLKNSHGSYLVDLCSEKGRNEYLDFTAYFATSPISYSHPELNSPEFKELLGAAAVHKPSSSDFWTLHMANFVQTFRDAMGDSGRDLPHLFLVSGGALAVENALKIAFDWKVKKNYGFENLSLERIRELAEQRRLQGDRVIGFDDAFHGRSGYTLTLTHTFDLRKYMLFPKFEDWVRVTNPKIIHPLAENLDAVEKKEKESLEAIEKYIAADGGQSFAAIIIEPIQGEGGDNHFRREFFEELRRIADEHDILLVYDEVQTGLGTTGKMWCYEHFGDKAKPDIISFGKKFQVCGAMAGRKIGELKFNVFSSDEDQTGKQWGKSRINSTFGGNLIDMVRCQKYLEIIQKEDLIESAARMGDYFLESLLGLQRENNDLITNVRGRGLMLAFDVLPFKNGDIIKTRSRLHRILKNNRILVLTTGPKGIRFRPHLDVTKDEVDKGIELLAKSFHELREA